MSLVARDGIPPLADNFVVRDDIPHIQGGLPIRPTWLSDWITRFKRWQLHVKKGLR